jgi:CDP-paratose 2-epimerase
MKTALVTGAAGLVGSQAATRLAAEGFRVIGIDNDARRRFFGREASTAWRRDELQATVPGYEHHAVDIRDRARIRNIFRRHGRDIAVIIHAAAQPAHDWAARAPAIDFSINAGGTLVLLEAARRWSPGASFIFLSSNKVYGDHPNRLPVIEGDRCWEVASDDPRAAHGIDETMSVDQTTHSLFGASKLAADVLVQEYGKYYGMNTGCFRCGCITGPAHAATADHGFLAYVVRCAQTRTPYTIYGYKGKQVRDNIHASDLVEMFVAFARNPRPGEVYNAGGGRPRSCSVLEAIGLAEDLVGRRIDVHYAEANRKGDHVWWITDDRKFQSHYPEWSCSYDLGKMLAEICDALAGRAPAPSKDPAR